jgi:hypothetical protein
VDVFEPGSGPQLHDLNPSAAPPTGLFWTIEIPADGVEVDLARGIATMQASNVPILDFGSIENALTGMSLPDPGTVSFRVSWNGVGERLTIRNTSPVYGGFGGEFVRNQAQMEWSARVGNYEFRSAGIESSSSGFAQIGQERNGIFLR